MKFWPEYLIPKFWNEKYSLLGIFIILTAIKSVLGFSSKTPYVFADEFYYSGIAQNIFQGTFFSDLNYWKAFPPGYSFVLSPAYLFSGNKTLMYHIMLIINSILSASILFPSYFILKKYISHQQALLGSVLISVIPALTLFTFLLLSENLFIPLTMFSIWFLHEAFENNTLRWDLLAALSVFYLYFTRETGLVFVIALCIALAFFIVSTEKGARLSVIKNKVVLICALILPFILWILYKMSISRISYYGTELYIQILVHSFSDIIFFEKFSILLLHEIEYLVVSAYVTIFIISIIFIAGCLFKLNIFGLNDYLQQFRKEKILVLRSVILYCLSFSAGLLVITVTHMQRSEITSLFGRYIDPIVPVIFLFGILGIGSLFKKYPDLRWMPEIVICLGIPILFLLGDTLPDTFYLFPNTLGVFYFDFLRDRLSYPFFMAFLIVVFIFIPYYFLKNAHKDGFFIRFSVFFIILSLILFIPLYEANHENMRNMESMNQIGRYLQKHSSTDTQILLDSDYVTDTHILMNETYINRWWYPGLTQFWTPGTIIQRSTAEDPSGIFTKEFFDKADYIISQKFLPYPCVIASNNTYKLYTPHVTHHFVQNVSLPFMIGMDSESSSCIINGFYPAQGKDRWTSEFSEVKIQYPKEKGRFLLRISTGGHRPENNPANVSYVMNGHFIEPLEETNGTGIYSVIIPEDYLENNYQILGIRTNTWKPSDYGFTDTRNLGIAVSWIRLEDPSFNKTYDKMRAGQQSESLDLEVYGVEYWDYEPTYWMSNNASLVIQSDENRITNLTFRTISYSHPRTLEIYYGDTLQTTRRITTTGFTNVSAQFPLRKGDNTIRLYVPEGCDRPSDVSELNTIDKRCLSIAVQKVMVS